MMNKVISGFAALALCSNATPCTNGTAQPNVTNVTMMEPNVTNVTMMEPNVTNSTIMTPSTNGTAQPNVTNSTMMDECNSGLEISEKFLNGTCKVNPCLYGVLQNTDPNPATGYPVGFEFAWISDSSALEYLLQINANTSLSNLEKKTQTLTYVGLPEEMVSLGNYTYFVMDICNTDLITTTTPPTVAYWSYYLKSSHNISIPATVTNKYVQNPDNITSLVGCSVDVDLDSLNATNTYGCNDRFIAAVAMFNPYNPYVNDSPTAGADCFDQLLTLDKIKVEDFRAAVMICADVNAYNMGTGLVPSGDAYEYITPNIPFDEMREMGVDVTKISSGWEL